MKEMHMKHSVLELKNISKKLKGRNILDNVSVTFNSGQVTAIVGENGSGKSMLFRVISGLITSDQGKILYDGEEIRTKVSPVIGIMIDRASLFPEFNGYENLKYLAGIRKTANDKAIRDCIRRVGLNPDDKRLFEEYSLGMKQRLLLAQALIDDPDILILDEVTNGIDDNGKRLVYDIIREESQKDKIVIISSHVHADIQEVSDFVFRMDNGHCMPEIEVM